MFILHDDGIEAVEISHLAFFGFNSKLSSLLSCFLIEDNSSKDSVSANQGVIQASPIFGVVCPVKTQLQYWITW